MPLYTSVSGVQRKINGLFSGVSGVKREITQADAAISGVRRNIYKKENTEKAISSLSVGEEFILTETVGQTSSQVPFMVLGHGVQAGYTTVMRKYLWPDAISYDPESNIYDGSQLQQFIDAYYFYLPISVQYAIPQIERTFRYYSASKNRFDYVQCRVFPLHMSEMNRDDSYACDFEEPDMLAYYAGFHDDDQWKRYTSPQREASNASDAYWSMTSRRSSSQEVQIISRHGEQVCQTVYDAANIYVAPAFNLPFSFIV